MLKIIDRYLCRESFGLDGLQKGNWPISVLTLEKQLRITINMQINAKHLAPMVLNSTGACQSKHLARRRTLEHSKFDCVFILEHAQQPD